LCESRNTKQAALPEPHLTQAGHNDAQYKASVCLNACLLQLVVISDTIPINSWRCKITSGKGKR